MLSILALEIVCGLVLLHFIWKRFLSKNWTTLPEPPGPYGLPIVGYMPFLGRLPYIKMTKLAEKYGEILQVNIGTRKTVVINSLDAMKEAYIKVGGFMFFRNRNNHHTCATNPADCVNFDNIF